MNKNQIRIIKSMYGCFDDNTTPVEVKSLAMITDEHAIEVARLFNECDKAISESNLANAHAEMVKEQINDMWMITPIADFLRPNGYATPCFGHSVEELITMGVFKLREA